MVDFNNIKIEFPITKNGSPMMLRKLDTNELLQQLIEQQQILINIELQNQFYYNPNPNKVDFKIYLDTQIGIASGITTPLKVIYPRDIQVMQVHGLITRINIYTSGDILGSTGIFSLYDNGSPIPTWQGIPVNTASSFTGEGMIKLDVPIELVQSHALQYRITNNTGATLDYFIVVWGYNDKGYFVI